MQKILIFTIILIMCDLQVVHAKPSLAIGLVPLVTPLPTAAVGDFPIKSNYQRCA